MSWFRPIRRRSPSLMLGAGVLSWLLPRLLPMLLVLSPPAGATGGDDARWTVVCTAQGVRWVLMEPAPGTAAPAEDPTPRPATHEADPCPLCSVGAPPPPLPPQRAFDGAPWAAEALPPGAERPAACAITDWRRAPSRAPPTAV
jgi:hypothetical protein